MGVVRLKVSKDGQLCLTDDLRRALEVEEGGELIATIERHELRLRNVDAAIRRAQEAARAMKAKGASVDDFLSTRRRDAGM